MKLQDVIDAHNWLARQLEGGFHRSNVSEYRVRGVVVRFYARKFRDIGLGEAANVDLKSFDEGTRHGLSSEEKPGERFEADQIELG